MIRSILSINGNRSMNYLLQTVLSKRYNLIPVKDVFQGMKQLTDKDDIGLVIIDIDYNIDESRDFIQHIKTSGLYNDRPVIILSSDADMENDPAIGLSGYRFFNKPFSPLDILKCVDEIIYADTIKN
ncbi:MAG: hypothetical protein JSU05_06795 [Bacteroidetes bacterium]|nr:hypothetical protein [Bacteroidota bacterium]